MLDPIGGFRRIQNFVINYVETSFRISDKAAAKARRNLLETVDVLATEPFIEPVLRYESHPENLEQLAQRDDGPLAPMSWEGKRAFVELALSGLFDGKRCDVFYQGPLSPDFYGWIFPHGDTASIGDGGSLVLLQLLTEEAAPSKGSPRRSAGLRRKRADCEPNEENCTDPKRETANTDLAYEIA